METKRSEVKTKVKSLKIGGELAETDFSATSSRRSKSHLDSWRNRLFHEGYTHGGKRILSADWSVRIFRDGRRVAFQLATANAATAAAKAQAIYGYLVANGWPATIAKFKPESLPKVRPGTVGEVIAAASEIVTTRPQSFAQASLRLRQLAGETTKIKRPAHSTAYKSDEFKAWRAKVDAVPLTALTGEAVRSWRDGRISARATNPVEKRAATVSADSTIRMARSIFSKRILAAGLASKVALPSPLPFSGVTVGNSTRRFSEKVNAATLFASGRAKLEAERPEEFRAFALCILAGLRRSEADRLTWQQVDLTAQTITIERTAYFDPKSEESTRVIDLDAMAVEILRSAKADSPDPVFVLKGAAPRPQTKAAPFYRCDAAPWRTWRRLTAWLAANGVADGKPVHVLRKLAGSLVFTAHGLEQARGFLGHASIATTSASYLATAKRVTVSIPAPADEVSSARIASGAA